MAISIFEITKVTLPVAVVLGSAWVLTTGNNTGTLSAYRSNNRIFWHPKKKKDW